MNFLKKQIVLIHESENESYIDYAQNLMKGTDFEIISASPDINRYEAVVFVFEKEPHNNCKKLNEWVGHSHLRTVWGKSENEKMQMLKKVLLHIAGIPVPLEIERKYLIKYPDISFLEGMENCKGVGIEQIYLSPIEGKHIRIRKRTALGKDMYIKTEKKKISSTVRIETEEEIREKQYSDFAQHIDKDTLPIVKTRYCLAYSGYYFEIDIFPFWSDKAYLEIELTDENEAFELPLFVEVIKEVTEDKRYTNRSLAKLLKEGKTAEI